MRTYLVAVAAVAVLLAGCSSSVITVPSGPSASAAASIPSGTARPARLTETELAAVKVAAIAAFNDPTRPLIDTTAGAEDQAGTRYACSNVYGNGMSGLPFAGRFVSGGFQLLAKGGDFSATFAANDLCSKLGIRPRRIDP